MSLHLKTQLEKIRACRLCEGQMDRPPNPILQAHSGARILIASQAPGNKADRSGVPFNDPSGSRLRDWMQISEQDFYDPRRVAILPMGFCFPGYKNGADAPPRKECAPAWHNDFLLYLKPEVTLYVGRYSQQYYLPQHKTLTEAVRSPTETHFVLPHPSGRNNRWLAKNPWFELDTLPKLRDTVESVLKV